jgi:hypothetical protein
MGIWVYGASSHDSEKLGRSAYMNAALFLVPGFYVNVANDVNDHQEDEQESKR